MSKSKRVTLQVFGVLIVLIVLAAKGLVALRPAMPNTWHGLRAGLVQEQVLAAVEGRHVDVRDLKGYDLFTQETTMLDASCYWQLLVTYDRTGGLMHAEALFVLKSCGLLNVHPRSVL